ncbi:MAG TPA: GtrA family protein [Azospira sp.]|nr:GtrA family protein [Azospira sp.]
MKRSLPILVRQFLQYVLVGGLAFLVDYATLFLLTHFGGMHYLLAATVGFALGLAANYLLCIAWVFNQRTMNNQAAEFTAFALIGIMGLALNNGLMYVATDLAGIHYLISKLLAAACVLAFNFGLRRHFLFTDHTRGQAPQGEEHGQESANRRSRPGWADRSAGVGAPLGTSAVGGGSPGDGGRSRPYRNT